MRPETSADRMTDELSYSISEVAALTGLHRNTIRLRIRLGQLEADVRPGKFGDEYRITPAALNRAGMLTPGAEPVAESPTDGAEVPEDPQPTFEPATVEDGGDLLADPGGALVPPAAGDALRELVLRHEQAMFRLGYLQAELEQTRALAARAESLQEEHRGHADELERLRATLAAKEEEAADARALRVELADARARLGELARLRQELDTLQELAQRRESERRARADRPWWRLW